MILTVTLNPAIDKILILNYFEIHKLHRLEKNELSMVTPGGKGVNIAHNLKRLGNDVIASGFAGGHPGHMLCDALRDEGISTNFIFTSAETRTNISILDRERETLTEINDFGKELKQLDMDFFLENYVRLLNRVNLVVIAGSLPKGVPVSFLRTLIKKAREHGKKTIVHIPPGYLEVIMKESPFLLLPDMRSQHKLFNQKVDGINDFLKTGRHILANCPYTEYVIFTHRIENVVAITRERSYIIRPRNLKIVNMLGYGDAYLSGFIHAYMHKYSEDKMLQYASACGLTDVEDLYKEIADISKIDINLDRIEVEEVD